MIPPNHGIFGTLSCFPFFPFFFFFNLVVGWFVRQWRGEDKARGQTGPVNRGQR
jgi:hypothetical protein